MRLALKQFQQRKVTSLAASIKITPHKRVKRGAEKRIDTVGA